MKAFLTGADKKTGQAENSSLSHTIKTDVLGTGVGQYRETVLEVSDFDSQERGT